MLDLFSHHYFNAVEQNCLRLLAIMLSRIADRDMKTNPGRAMQLRSMLDVLVGWTPLNSGAGYLHMDLWRVGLIEIVLRDSMLKIMVTPWLPMGIQTSSHTVFTAIPGSPVISKSDGMKFAVNVVERASARYRGIDDHADFSMQWVPEPCPVPSRAWIERREAALQAGATPPMAIHWMHDGTTT